MHKRVQGKTEEMLQALWMAPTCAASQQAFNALVEMCGAKCPGARDCFPQHRHGLLAFYDLPAEH